MEGGRRGGGKSPILWQVFSVQMANSRRFMQPNYIQILWNYDQRRIIIRPATETTEEAIDVPKEEFDGSLLSLTTFLTQNPIDAMGWGKTPYELEAELVRDNDDHIALLLDLKKAHPVEQINGCFITPSCLK